MILISFLLLIGAVVTLVIGWLQEGLTMVFVSIGVTAAAGIFLVADMVRRRTVTPATAGAPYGPAQGTKEAATAPAEPKERAKPRAPLPQRRPAAKKPTGRPEEPVEPSSETAKKPAAKKPAAKKPAAKKPAAKKPAAKKPAAKKPAAKKPAAKKPTTRKPTAKKPGAASRPSPRSQVISIPERGTFHKSDCRYVKGRRDTERITLGTAEKRGYSSCGVCKPTTS